MILIGSVYYQKIMDTPEFEVRFEPTPHEIICGLIEKYCIGNPSYNSGFKAVVYALVKAELIKRFPDLQENSSLTIEKAEVLMHYKNMADAQWIYHQIMEELERLEAQGDFNPGFIRCLTTEKQLNFSWNRTC